LTIKLAPRVTPAPPKRLRRVARQVRLHIALERNLRSARCTLRPELPGPASRSCQPDSVFKERPSRSRRNGPRRPAQAGPRGETKNPASSAGHNRHPPSRRFRSKLDRFLSRIRDQPLSGSQPARGGLAQISSCRPIPWNRTGKHRAARRLPVSSPTSGPRCFRRPAPNRAV
jgi:hypothetical protein